jgi:hypothetical protein
MSENIIWFHLRKIELLWAEDRTWSGDSNPPYKCLSGNLEVLHCPKANESSCSTETSFTVNSNSTMIWSSKVILNNSHEISNNFIRWSGSINKEKVIMSDSFMFKMLFIVFFFIKSNYPGYINIVKDITILVWMLAILMSGISSFNRSHKSDKLSWNNPVQVTVFNSLVVLVFFHVESFEVVPVEFNCVF